VQVAWLQLASELPLLAQAVRPVVGAPTVSEQCPTLPALLHDWQGCVASHFESQQTPSTQ
jgi:hypothetical protein